MGPVGKVFDPNFMLQMDSSGLIKQLLVVPIKVRRWPALLSPSEIHQVASQLEPIGDLKNKQSNGYLVEVLVQLWDPSCSAFRIKNREITVTIEEVAGLLNLLVLTTVVIFLFVSDKIEFCHFIGLKESVVQESDQSIDVKFLFN